MSWSVGEGGQPAGWNVEIFKSLVLYENGTYSDSLVDFESNGGKIVGLWPAGQKLDQVQWWLVSSDHKKYGWSVSVNHKTMW